MWLNTLRLLFVILWGEFLSYVQFRVFSVNSCIRILVNKVFLYCLRGVVLNEDDNAFAECWKECTEVMKRRFRSVVLPIGSLSIGLCVHRALLFKVNLTTSLFLFIAFCSILMLPMFVLNTYYLDVEWKTATY